MACLGRLVAGVAHEVNNPLGALQSSVNTMGIAAGKLSGWCKGQNPAIAERINALVDTLTAVSAQAESSCNRVTGVIENLKQFAQLDRAEVQWTNVHAGIESTLRLLQHAFGDRIDVVTEFGELPEIQCSPRDLNQLFMNLLLNATEAIDGAGGRGRVVVRTSAHEDCVIVEISDNGGGIAEEHLDKIFDPGFTTKGVRVGTGLGLAVCHQIVRAHQGKIEVASQPGAGAAFTVTLPRRPPEPE
ncbi:MAG: ATPase [Acidobacteriales bacterium]|nr:MAG: ATPase [Terriglobales bacterium]